MTNDLKLGLKTLRYAYGRLGNLVGSAIMIVMGLGMFAFRIAMAERGYMGLSGGVFLLIGAMFPVQLVYSLSVAGLVQSSPVKKRMQTSVPAVICCCGMLIMYFLYVALSVVLGKVYRQAEGMLCDELVSMAVFAFFIMIYLAVAYKYFFVSLFMFFGVFFFCYDGMTQGTLVEIGCFAGGGGESLALAALLGAAVIAVGGLAQYFVSLLVYKAPMSKMAQAASLRKTL